MKKHITLFFMIIATLCLSMFFISCGEKEDKAKLTLNKTSVNMVLGFTDNVSASYNQLEGYSLTWSSSDDSIVTVNNGALEAMGLGNATVTATYSNGTDNYTANTNVTVSLGGYVPTLCLENYIDEDTWNIVKGDSVEFKPYVYFNGVKFYDVQVSIAAGNDAIFSYANNTITALDAGSTNIVLEGTWRGISFNGKNAMGISLGVNICNSFTLLLNDGAVVDEIKLYARDDWEGQALMTRMPFALSMLHNGVVSNVPVNVEIVDENVVAIENGNLVRTGFGATQINLSWTSPDGEAYDKTIDVEIIRPIGYCNEVIPYFSAIDGVALYDINNDGKYEETTLAQILYGKNTDKVIIEATQTYYNDYTKSTITDDVLTVSNNTINGVYTHSTGMRDVTITLGTQTEIYVVNVKACAKVFAQDNIEEFYPTIAGTASSEVKFKWYQDGGVVGDYEYYYTHKDDKQHRGYYTLCESLDFKDITITASSSPKFAGMFDGNGYVISNLSFAGGSKLTAAGGLFGTLDCIRELTNTGVEIKNVAFTGVNFNSANCTVIGYRAVATSKTHVKLSNIYVQINKQDTYQNGCAPLFIESNFIYMNNVIVDYPIGSGYDIPDLSDTDSNCLGSLIALMNKTGTVNQKFNDVYVISSVILGHQGGKDAGALSSQDASNVVDTKYTKVAGAYRYETLDKMKDDKERDYTSFDNTFWSLTTGVPVWAKLPLV